MKRSMATAATVERVQKIYDRVGVHGGYITTASGFERDLYLLIELDNGEYVSALIGHFTRVGNDTCYDPVFHLMMDTKQGKIKEIEIKKYYAQNLMSTIEIYPNGRVYYDGAETEERKDLVEFFGDFIYEIVEAFTYLDEDSTVYKYEKATCEN